MSVRRCRQSDLLRSGQLTCELQRHGVNDLLTLYTRRALHHGQGTRKAAVIRVSRIRSANEAYGLLIAAQGVRVMTMLQLAVGHAASEKKECWQAQADHEGMACKLSQAREMRLASN